MSLVKLTCNEFAIFMMRFYCRESVGLDALLTDIFCTQCTLGFQTPGEEIFGPQKHTRT